MTRYRRMPVIIVALILCAEAMFLLAHTFPQPILWLEDPGELSVQPGETVVLEASFTSAVAIPNVVCILTPGFEPLVPSRNVWVGDVEADRVYTVRYLIQVPESASRQTYAGNLQVNESVRLNRRSAELLYPRVLPVVIHVR